MVSVGRVGGPAVPNTGARRVTGGGGFAVGASPAGAAQAPAEAAPAAALDAMLTLQAAEDAPARDRQARRHGKAMLDELAALQRALLDGEPSPEALGRLAALAEQPPEAADPALRATLAALTLRAQVELARRSM